MWRNRRCLIQLRMQSNCFNIGWIIFTTMTSNERLGVSDHWQLGCLFKPTQSVITRSKYSLAVCHIWIFRRNYFIQAERETLKQWCFYQLYRWLNQSASSFHTYPLCGSRQRSFNHMTLSWCNWDTGSFFNIKTAFVCIGIPITKIRLSWESLHW